MKTKRNFLRDDSGSSAVEFAILAIPLFMLLFGTVEFGRVYWSNQALQDVATSGARCAGILQPACAADGKLDVAKAKAHIAAEARTLGILLAEADITVTDKATCSGLPGFSKVSVSYEFKSPMGPLLAALSKGATLTGAACFPNQET